MGGVEWYIARNWGAYSAVVVVFTGADSAGLQVAAEQSVYIQ